MRTLLVLGCALVQLLITSAVGEQGPWSDFAELGNGRTACALDREGSAWCWGELVAANGSLVSHAAPQLVPGNHTWAQLAVGRAVACGVLASAGRHEGQLLCWGDNSAASGRLLGPTAGAFSVEPVARLPGPEFLWASVSVGNDSACGILTTGEVYCWGSGWDIGNEGATASQSLIGIGRENVSAVATFSRVQVGSGYACGIQTDRSIWCWGSNRLGHLGRGGVPLGGSSMVPVAALGDGEWIDIVTSTTLACALDANRTVACWGNMNPEPTMLDTQLYHIGSHIDCAGLNDGTFCLIFPENEVWCVTSGPTFETLTFAGSIEGNLISVEAGLDYFCARSDAGGIYCWGNNTVGQLGLGYLSAPLFSTQDGGLITLPAGFFNASAVLSPVMPAALPSPGETSPQPPAVASSGNTSSSSGSKTATLVGGIIGGVVLLLVAAGAFALYSRRQRKQRSVVSDLKPFEGAVHEKDCASNVSATSGSAAHRQPPSEPAPLSTSRPNDLGQQDPAWDTLGAGHSRASSALLSNAPPQLVSPSSTIPMIDISKLVFCKNADGSRCRLGKGSFGKVYKVLLDGVQPLAAKALSIEPEYYQQFIEEATMLWKLRHPNMINLAGVAMSRGRGFLLMEYAEGGSLYNKLNAVRISTGRRVFSWYDKGQALMVEVAGALHFLHSLTCCHFDIKSSNVLLTRDFHAKLADVGLAKMTSGTQYSCGDLRGTLAYMAPELLTGSRCTQAVDIYSFGVLLHEMCTGHRPQRGELEKLKVPEHCPQAVADLYEDCVSADPAARPSAKQLLERLRGIPAQQPPLFPLGIGSPGFQGTGSAATASVAVGVELGGASGETLADTCAEAEAAQQLESAEQGQLVQQRLKFPPPLVSPFAAMREQALAGPC